MDDRLLRKMSRASRRIRIAAGNGDVETMARGLLALIREVCGDQSFEDHLRSVAEEAARLKSSPP